MSIKNVNEEERIKPKKSIKASINKDHQNSNYKLQTNLKLQTNNQ